VNAPLDATLEQVRSTLDGGFSNGALVITDDDAMASLATGTDMLVLSARQADERRDHLPQVDLALVDAEAGFADEASAVQLISRLRDVQAVQVLVIGPRQSPTLMGRQQLIGLGFRRWATTGEGDERRRWYEFSLADYKVTPDWLNARHWANPELWDRYRW
jgi:hypothetical protein